MKKILQSGDLSLRIVWPMVDAISVIVCSYIAYYVRFLSFEMHDRYKIATVIISILIVAFSSYSSLYYRWNELKWSSVLFKIISAWCIAVLSAAALIYVLNVSIQFSRVWMGITLSGGMCLAIILRALIIKIFRMANNSTYFKKKIFFIRASSSPKMLLHKLKKDSNVNYTLAGEFEVDKALKKENLAVIVENIEQSQAKEVWLSFPLESGNDVKLLIHALRFLTIEIRFFPALTDLSLLNHKVSEILGFYSLDLNISPIKGAARFFKRLEDLVLGIPILLLISPICMLILIAIKMTSPGPVLFKQYRTGINGKNFKIYKFRTMKVHKETKGNITQAVKGDSRVTKFGAFLRRTSLDELPQFYNVLQGRMSIVGPRPHALAHNQYYMELVESYMQRHKVKPGITGWAQVCGLRGETDTLEKMQQRVRYDLWYIENWSITFDMKIIMMTIFRGFFSKNAY